MTREADVRTHATSLGFHRVGIARAVDLAEDHARYRSFVERGAHGEMKWLAEHDEVRARVDAPTILDGAKSVIVCALAYHRDGVDDGPAGPDGAVIARYARGQDYHGFFRKRLRRFADWIRAEFPGHDARAVVDTAPVLERAWARLAGVGFVGKNGMVIVPGLGSYVLLGEVITTVEFASDEPMASRCGECTRCLDACPTDAFDRAYVLDARRCVSYLTIELRGEIPESLREGVGNRLFGCDVCQEVCPYNRTAAPPASTTAPFATNARWRDLDLATLVRLDDVQFRAVTEGSPLSRPKRAGLVRNAIVVMANSRERRHLPVLRDVSERDVDPMVRATARWAIDALERDVDNVATRAASHEGRSERSTPRK
jgi:epoxyqueuosine reductase